MDADDPLPAVPFASSRPWSPARPQSLVVCCSDGRYHPHLEEFTLARVSERPDVIALPGGPAAVDSWASSFDHRRIFAEAFALLSRSHDLRSVWLVAHEGCSYYRTKHPGSDAEALRRRQFTDLRRARELILERSPAADVRLIHARVDGGRVLFEEVAPG
jgi:hypothetical protein